jgi:DNA-directed RNA polymerase specialized sigma24 family protein
MSEAHKNGSSSTPEVAQLVHLARALPTECRRVFTLRKVYGCSEREIADRLGIPEHAVERHLIQAACLLAHAVEEAYRRCAGGDAAQAERPRSFLQKLRARVTHA